MAGDIKLDVANLETALDQLNESIEVFESYTTTFNQSTRDRFDSFNSDFIAKVDGLLDNMNDDMSSDLLEQLKAIYQTGDALLTTMRETDEFIAGEIGSGSS